MWDSLLPGVHSFSAFASSKALPKCGRRRCPPLGAFNPPPHRGRACGMHMSSSCQFLLCPSFFLYLLHLKASDPSLFLSPGAWGPPDRRPRFPSSTFFGPLVLIFCSSETLFKIYIEKMTKKMRKSRILASQNLPKTFPKSLQNGTPKKHAIFHGFLLEF